MTEGQKIAANFRRERIATACLAGLLAADWDKSVQDFVEGAVELADALIAELDKKGDA